MDNNLEYKILFREQSEKNTEYCWSLQEFDKEDKKIGGDFVPLESWSIYFTAKELIYNYSLDVGNFSHDSKETNEEVESIKEDGSIWGVLHPKGHVDNITSTANPCYSMFGTSLPSCEIKDFILIVRKNNSPNDKAKCHLQGNIYSNDESTKPSIWVCISLTPQQFDKIANRVKSKSLDRLEISLNYPRGFYHELPPALYGEKANIKILTDEKYHKFETPGGCKVNPYRLGQVDGFNINLTQRYLGPEDDLEAEEEGETIEISKPNDEKLSILSRLESLEKSVVLPLWLIVGFLFGIILYLRWS